MLDKFITYIVCWYKILYQTLPVAWTNRITTRHDRDSKWYWFTQQARPDTKYCTNTLYVMGIYHIMGQSPNYGRNSNILNPDP
jgi:hypothetical protein